MSILTVKHIMSEEIISVLESEPITKFENYFKKRNIHHVLVENEEGNLIGIISSEDVAKSKSWIVKDKIVASDIMTKNPITIKETTILEDAKSIFIENRYRALPVLNEFNKIVGIITPYDFMVKLE